MSIQKLETIMEPAKETAKKIRVALKLNFPNTKFSVRTDVYSGGSSVNVSWTDLPLVDEVETIVNQFKSGSFDGMTDMYETSGYIMDGKRFVGAKYIFTSRKLSDERKELIKNWMKENYCEVDENSYDYYYHFNKAEELMIKEETKQLETVQQTEVKENNLTNEQNETLSNRLNKSNVKPLRLFKSNNSDSILLESLNTNLNNPEPFYFIINSKGESFGKGYNYPLNEYTVIETYENESIESEQTETQLEPQNEQISFQTGTGNKGNGIEITFDSKPSEEVRNAIKAAGYRWGGKQRPNIWWAIETNESLSIAEQLATKQETQSIDYSYPEIEIDDNDSYTIGQSLQDREHDSAWIFRQNKIDHNKEIKNMFTDYTNQVKSILENTSNDYFIYKLKSGLQRFKKKYHSLYIKYLSHKANNPSWAVTGRGNLNISKYNQAMQQQNNIMSELADLPKQFESELNKYKNKIRKGA